jgi:hypothetical protein
MLFSEVVNSSIFFVEEAGATAIGNTKATQRLLPLCHDSHK